MLKKSAMFIAASVAFAGAAISEVASANDVLGLNAVYFYPGWGNPQDPVKAMSETGIKQFTLAFMLSDSGSCSPVWDGWAQLNSNPWNSIIKNVRGNGGDVLVSFGGSSGDRLGIACKNPSELATAYQKVINTLRVRAIELDIEGDELYKSAKVRKRIIDALKIVQANDKSLKIYIIPACFDENGPDSVGTDLIKMGADAGLDVVWVNMPFALGGHHGTMASASARSSDGLMQVVKEAYGYDTETAYNHIGISSMNGKTGERGETITVDDFNSMLKYAQKYHIGRFTFWSLNRDRPCDNRNSDEDTCSGVSDTPYVFTKILAKYHG